MVAWLGRLGGPRPKDARMSIVLLSQPHARRIERRDHPCIDSVDAWRIGIKRRHVRDATALLAAMERQPAVAPCVCVREVCPLHERHVAGIRIGPDRTIAATDRAIAVEDPIRKFRDFETDGGAMTSSSNHEGALSRQYLCRPIVHGACRV
jgi:hypothetical protein